MRIFAGFVVLMAVASNSALASEENNNRSAAPAHASAYIISPANGEQVGKHFTIKFGLQGMGVAPAGTAKKGTGHFHLVIDNKLPPFDRVMGKQVRHFGGGQTQTTLELPAGQHTLQLIMGDARHIPHQPAVFSRPVTITVK